MESCATSPKPSPVAKKPQGEPLDTSDLIPKEANKTAPISETLGDPDCVALPEELQILPKFSNTTGTFITRFLKSCQTTDGKNGIKQGSPWTALGFPCTGGRGEFDWKGSQYAPKLVTFKFINSCPMLVPRQTELDRGIRAEIPIPMDSKLIAYYPFSVIYWEVPQYGDADVGHKLELFSPLARAEGYKAFQANKPLYVRLYGRENALVRTKNLYQVDGHVRMEGEHLFRFYVEKVKILQTEEIDQLKEKCRNLKPRRRCHDLF